ncbi:hypothetical protein FRC03_002805 [Tulasnella sp. 419]|nr:hypothetical protein FRC03_002805 [Tulasnella sp. 419]
MSSNRWIGCWKSLPDDLNEFVDSMDNMRLWVTRCRPMIEYRGPRYKNSSTCHTSFPRGTNRR